MIFFNYTQALQYLNDSCYHDTSNGLARARAVLRQLDDPHTKMPIIHVAGTNGKGSLCAYLNAILSEEGYSVGVFTSPHLLRVNERIAVDNQPISDDAFAELLNRTVQAAERAGDREPFVFELLTIMAFDYFAQCGVDIAIIETGIGGRLDVTNVVESPVLSVIASIGYDHMEILGNTLTQIAREKAGIIKEGCPVAVYPTETISVFMEAAREKKAGLYYAGDTLAFSDITYNLHGSVFSVQNAYYAYQSLTISLLGKQQLQNAAHALLCIQALRDAGIAVSDCSVRAGLSNTKWPGRFEYFSGKPSFILDGAHNTDGAVCFNDALGLYFPDKRIVLVAGMLRTKDCRNVMRMLAARADVVICTEPPADKALPATVLADYIEKDNVIVIPNARDAFRAATKQAGKYGIAAVVGSLYLIADAYEQRIYEMR